MYRALATAFFGFLLCAASAGAGARDPLAGIKPKHADFGGVSAPRDVQRIAHWALDSGDHEGLPFVVIDKRAAHVYVFTPSGRLKGHAPILLGRAIGDEFAPGVIDMDMYETSAWQRVTPAGRFRAEQYRKSDGTWILWVDYDSAIALHKVVLNNGGEARQARLGSTDPAQRRITYGCINVPISFYDRVVHPTFRLSDGIVYVLPETRPVQAVFANYTVPHEAAGDAAQESALSRSHAGALPHRRHAPEPFDRPASILLPLAVARQNGEIEGREANG